MEEDNEIIKEKQKLMCTKELRDNLTHLTLELVVLLVTKWAKSLPNMLD